jgi:HEAT repeat protein
MRCLIPYHFRAELTLLVLLMTAAASLAQQREPSAEKTPAEKAIPETKEAAAELPWIDSLAKGLTQSQKSRKPIFAVVGGKSCPYCRQLEGEMKKAAAQKELARWTLVALDVDASPDDARSLAVGPIPALRVLTPAGKSVASHDGTLADDDLVTWLQEQFDSAVGLNPDLIAGDSLTPLNAIKLVKEFRRRDPAVREAAIRQLLPHPQVAAGPVTTAFTEGSLSTRLAAMELLESWKAPVQGVDPWRPETLTEERLKAINSWAEKLDEAAASALKKPKELTKEELGSGTEAIARLLAAPPSDAAAIREQLARHGAALLPLVYQQLKASETDETRERLTTLRYRLVAGDRLVLAWPGGIERLAAANAATRRQAMDELADRAGPEDEALLLELFSDPEPLLRELALRALYRISGENADSALIRLLEDPEPNVRAAVLKQLAESSPKSVIPKIAKYVEQERDPDLVVQAIRVLRESSVKTSIERLTSLLSHESWRVRAEAAEALGKVVENSGRTGSGNLEGQADIYVALVELLKDEDPFVVSRAVIVLGKANLVTAVDPLAEVASRHPELAVTVVTALAGSRASGTKVEQHLQKFSQSQDPKVRAAAITGLCALGASELEKELKKALGDADSAVRIAAAEGVFDILNHESATADVFLAPQPPVPVPAPPAEQADTQEEKKVEPADGDKPSEAEAPEDPEEEVQRLRKSFPKWLPEIEPQLTNLLSSPSNDERMASALPLVAAGHFDQALPVLTVLAKEEPNFGEKIAAALYWLPWDKRTALFNDLISVAKTPDQLGSVADGLARRRDMRAAEPLWTMLAQKDASGKLAEHVLNSLKHLYLGNRWHSPQEASRAERDRLQTDARRRAKEGSRWQRLSAFSLLILVGDEETAVIARAMKSKEGASETDQLDAFRVLLLSADAAEAATEAQGSLASPRGDFRSLALAYFTVGSSAAASLEEESFNLDTLHSRSAAASPKIPDDLKPEHLLPLLKGENQEQAAQAGYLLCLLEKPEGLAPLVDYWRGKKRSDSRWRKLVYTAAASLGGEEVALLEEIYSGMGIKMTTDYSDAADFYWTIRSLTGPSALALRKRVREEVGMDNLRMYAPSGAP